MEAYPAPSVLVSGAEAYFSSLVGVLAFFVALISALMTYPRAFTNQPYLPTGSPLQFMNVRCRLLFIAAILMLVSTLHYDFHLYMMFTFGTAKFAITAWAQSTLLVVVDALMTLATCMRCSMIVSNDSKTRRRFSMGMLVLAVLMVAAVVGDNSRRTLELALAWPPLTASDWFHASLSSRWIPLLLLTFPVMAVAGSIWALRHNARYHHRRQPPSNRASRSGVVTISAVPDRVPILMRLASDRVRRMTMKLARPSSAAGSRHAAPIPSASSLTMPSAGPSTVAESRVLPTVAAVVSRPSSQSTSIRIQYPISATFKLITYMLIFGWSVAIGVASVSRIGPVYSHALILLLQSLGILLEGLFELIIKLTNNHVEAARGADGDAGGGGGHFVESAVTGIKNPTTTGQVVSSYASSHSPELPAVRQECRVENIQE
ncbi:hypothetical protein BC828DRAFT_403724 [Blastocladiella britannica]|nr:hypothetical protein BC828DRAFT_403724 [Blastocladiella britannica]